jgi:hypothetical protein
MSTHPTTPVLATPVLSYRERQKISKREHYLANRDELKARALVRYYEKHEQCKTESRERARKTKARLAELEALILKKEENPSQV